MSTVNKGYEKNVVQHFVHVVQQRKFTCTANGTLKQLLKICKQN